MEGAFFETGQGLDKGNFYLALVVVWGLFKQRIKMIKWIVRKAKLRFLWILFALLLGSGLFFIMARSSQAGEAQLSAGGNVTVLESSADKLVFEINVPALERRALSLPIGSFEEIRLAGYNHIGQPGQPDLPQRAFLVALPPGAQPVLTLLEQEQTTVAGVRVAPAPRTDLISYNPDDLSEVPVFEQSYPLDETLYNQNTLFPADPVILGQESQLRDQRVVSILVRPVQANPAAETLQVAGRLRIQVEFTYPNGRPALVSPRPESEVYEQLLASNLLNYEQAIAWRSIPTSKINRSPEVNPCLDNNAYRITVNQTGIYEISHSQLPGLPASVAVANLRMCHQGQLIRIKVEDNDSDGNFESGDRVVFYGEAIKTQETTTNVYWLTYGGNTAGLFMQTASGAPGSATVASSHPVTMHLETDAIYYGRMPSCDCNDHWYPDVPLEGLVGSSQRTLTFNFTVNNKASGNYDIPIHIQMWGWLYTETHSFTVKLNNTTVGTGGFYGSGITDDGLLYEVNAPSSALLEGPNTLTIQADPIPGQNPPHKFLVDWADIVPRRQFVALNNRLAFRQPQAGNWKYAATGFTGSAEIFDVTDPLNPLRITGATGSGTITFERPGPAAYEMVATSARLSPLTIVKDTPSNLRLSTNRADYIIITDPTLAGALTPLINHRTSQGLAVKVAYVQDIFDEFSEDVSPNYTSGLYSPDAIQAFLDYAYHNWQAPAPSYVLLAGVGSYDHRNLTQSNGSGGNLVPVYLMSGIDSNLGETVSDNHYADLTGDRIPEMHIGRFPASTSAELSNMVNKTIARETTPIATWMGTQFYVVDNGRVPTPCNQDPAGDFFATANNFIANHFPAGQLLQRAYYAPSQCYPNASYPLYEPHFMPSNAAMTERILNQFNQGKQFIVYMGHSGTQVWGHENFFSVSNISQLNNGNRTPIMLPMTCLEGYFQNPASDSLSEALLKASNGAVASFAPTGFQVQQGHDYLLQGFYQSVYTLDQRILGQAVFQAKLHLHENAPDSFQNLVDTYVLLGDPALRYKVWEYESQLMLPVIPRK